MAMAVVGYVGSMMAALAVLVVLLNSFIDPYSLKRTRPHPHPRPPIAESAKHEQSARPENKAGRGGFSVAITANALTTNPPPTEDTKAARMRKSSRVESKKAASTRLAEFQRRKLIAPQHEGMGYPSALGYQQETTYDQWRLPFAGPRY